MNQNLFFVLITCMLLLLYGCSTISQRSGVVGLEVSESLAIELEQQENWREAATVYRKIAVLESSPKRQIYELRAVQLLLKAKMLDMAEQVLSDVRLDSEVAPEVEQYYQYLGVRLAILKRDPDLAKELFRTFPAGESSYVSALDYQRMKVAVYTLLNQHLDASLARIELETLLSDQEKIDTNQIALLSSLMTFSVKELGRIKSTSESLVVKGWVSLAELTKKTQDLLRLSGLVNSWRMEYPDHPVSEALLASISPPADDQPLSLDKIALLLPFEGPFSKAAIAVRDGFLAAYYAQDSIDKPEIGLYNTGPDAIDIVSVYEKAVDEGASVVVGPLNKQALEVLVEDGDISIPTVALNQIDILPGLAENFFQFGLSPEQEAEQIAHRAWADGHTQVAAIYPQGSWGERVYDSFRRTWEDLGGTLVSKEAYNPTNTDFSKPIKRLLNISQSEDRRNRLSKELGVNFRFEPRRRQDIDMIFMAAFPRQARLIPPQMKFYRAGGIAIYATSHAFSGTQDRKADRDMNNVIIGDMPWTIGTTYNPQVKKDVTRTRPTALKKLSRLYALGADAYHLLYYLNWMRANNNAKLMGNTGTLQMNDKKMITRQLSWAKFVRGRPVLLSSNPVIVASP